MKVAVYLRISEAAEGDELGVTRQREDADALLARRGWTDARYFVENNTSATRGERAVWDEMMRAVENGEIGVVVGWTIDRVLRSGRDRLRMLDAGRAHGVILAPVRGSEMDLGTPAGRLTADILGAVALNEMEQKSDRQRRAARQRADAGLPWVSRRPFGFESDGMTVREHEAARVRQAYADLIAGHSLRSIAAGWNAEKVTTSTGAGWRAEQVHQMLRNPRYAGLRGYRGHDRTNGEQIITTKLSGGRAAWPEIVSEDTWRAAHAILTDPARRVGGSRARRHLLTGLVVCGRCGKPMGSGQATSTGAPVYRCRPSQHLSRAVEHVDALVRDAVVARLSRPDAAALLVDDDRPDARELGDEAATLRRRLDDVAVEFADGALTASQLRAMTERLRARLSEVESRMRDASRAPVLDELAGAPDAGARFDALDLNRRRAVVGALLTATILPTGRGRGFDPSSVRLDWHD